MQRLIKEFAFSQRHACELVEIPWSTHRYRSRKNDGVLRERLLALAPEQPRYGSRRLCVLLNDGGAAGLQVKRIRRRRLSRSAAPRVNLTTANQEWALDFASDVTASGRRIRVLGCDRRIHARMFGAGDRHKFPQPQIDQGVGGRNCTARETSIAAIRQRAGDD